MFVPYSKIKSGDRPHSKQEGYITDYEVDTEGDAPANQDHEQARESHERDHRPEARQQPGLRRYVGAQEIPRVLGGMGIAILSTPRGIFPGHEAKKQNVGGELLAYVW